MSNYNLSNQLPINTYEQIVQFEAESSSFTDGTGSLLTSINLTSSNAISTSYSLWSDFAESCVFF